MDDALAALGWTQAFAVQVTAEESGTPARVIGVRRDRIGALCPTGPLELLLPGDILAGDIAVGDWVLADAEGRVARVLDRQSRIFRAAAGDAAREQLIVANVDCVFITTSCTEEFNEARLERYLALAHAGGVPPVFVLTKPDLTAEPESFRARLAAIGPDVPAILLNAKAPGEAERLMRWCGPGRTVAFLGMSGVGKSTLAGALTGLDLETGAVREDDMRGRHTTTQRSMHPIRGGGWLIDTPGMRELKLTDMADGIDEAFAEITGLAEHCRFSDCRHESEPGCAILAAVADGSIDPARLARWQKLRAEDAQNSATRAERLKRDRAFGKKVRAAKTLKSRRIGRQ